MIKKKTVFVLGAGASVDFGLPLGPKLVQNLKSDLDLKYKFGSQLISGKPIIEQAIKSHLNAIGKLQEFKEYISSCWLLSAGLALAPLSIDTYLDTHAHDERMVFSGKVAIASTILDSEAKSPLNQAHRNTAEPYRIDGLTQTWYPRFHRLLFSGVKRSEVANVFDNISIISFNYDRCIEHYLYNMLKGYFHISDGEAANSLSTLRIFHPYGVVAPLPWQSQSESIEFGGDVYERLLRAAGARIRLFTEGKADPIQINSMQSELAVADQIVFLGFAFHQQNIDLLSVPKVNRDLCVYGTAHGISDDDIPAVSSQLRKSFGKKDRGIVKLNNKWLCADLFDNLFHTMA